MLIELNDIEMYYEVYGEGNPIIVLHGNGGNIKTVRNITGYYQKNYTVYALDSREHGKTTKSKNLTYDMMANDVISFIEKLNLKRPLIIGVSDGGIIGLIVGTKISEKLSGIIACSANIDNDGLKPKYSSIFKFAYKITKNLKIGLMVNPFYVTEEELSKIQIPTLVIAGENDMMTNEHTEKIAKYIKSSELQILANEGHCTYISAKKFEKSNKINEFIKKNSL